jgi:4-hydroxy-3-polyprenylbenzoate decarboxylase
MPQSKERSNVGALHPLAYPVFHVTAITHRQDAMYPATIVGIPPMEDFYIGGASVKLFLPIFKMNFPEIVGIAK